MTLIFTNDAIAVEYVCEQMGSCEFDDRDSLVSFLADTLNEVSDTYPAIRDTANVEWMMERLNDNVSEQGFDPLTYGDF